MNILKGQRKYSNTNRGGGDCRFIFWHAWGTPLCRNYGEVLPWWFSGFSLKCPNTLKLHVYFSQQARTQTFEEGGANLRVFTKGGASLKKILILRPKLGGVNSVSGEILHDFEIICPAGGGGIFTPPTPPPPRSLPAYGPGQCILCYGAYSVMNLLKYLWIDDSNAKKKSRVFISHWSLALSPSSSLRWSHWQRHR